MGNAGASGFTRERQKSGDTAPPSPSREDQAFSFDKKIDKLVLQSSQEDEEPYFTKPAVQDAYDPSRPRSNTLSEGTKTNVSDKTPQFFVGKTIPMVKSHGDFVTIIDLPEGSHQYKFFVDGEWRNDPSTNIVESDAGTKNNIVVVKKSDFEVFQALAKDSENAQGDIQEEYSQIIPPSKPWEKASGPPILPPHLLQVILNKDTPLSCEPTLLPEPNHVMLNHLYALSIKEGVMVLSATHRYRKKYVTTLLYKPI
ncbi:amp-activated protein kinase beta subunit [Holotrichia oblita]|uniref:Amp-activated protein kinase beta subunit n=1 Tax=Holotrichia oblita TaxID=644536 RepID=A0ACB9TAA2_HOLOL|nr:amp-activated protein kinase beta subunit [Holotrichia oblita]